VAIRLTLFRASCLALLALLVLAPSTVIRADGSAPKTDLPAKVREYLAKTYFDDCDPADARIDKAVEVLRVPDSMLEHIRANEWEAGQLTNFATNKLHLLVKTPAGEARSIVFRDGSPRNNRALSPDRERILRRLYGDAAFSAPEAEVLKLARADAQQDPAAILKLALARLDDKHALDEATIKRATDNLARSAGQGRELAIGLNALGRTKYPVDDTWAGLWLLSRLDVMDFDREDGKGSINDLQTMDARTFFENVSLATRARKEFPWGAKCTDSDFLQQVLSPRGTGEPLQRWRRHFFEAMEPELRELDDAAAAINLARTAAYDFFRYEGATTWEDYGMLTALAVHEGRCEDCSNVENCMLRAAGFPAAQAFTPWWGHQDGNHAWTVIPSVDGGKHGDGAPAAKVYLKTWDKLEDITKANTAVVDVPVELDEGVTGEKAALHVWNHEEWRIVARSVIEGRKVVFKDVGCSRDFVFLVRADNSADRLVSLAGGKAELLANPELPGDGKFKMTLATKSELGEFATSEPCKLLVSTSAGWIEVPLVREDEGVSFSCDPHALYRFECKGIHARPFRVRADKSLQRY
jgi:hypothetical protein